MKYCLLIIFVLFYYKVNAQNNFNLSKESTKKIKFQLIENLIVIPVEINGVKLSFILDTGVSKPILFNIVNTDSLQIKDVETIYLKGLGSGGSIEALKSSRNFFKIGNAINVNQDIYVVFDAEINFTPRLGVPVHGIIGYDIFKNFVVELNYISKYIRLHKPETFKYKTSKKWQTISINIHNKKPFLDAYVEINTIKKHPVKLLIDTGGSDALWLFEDNNKNINPNKDLFFEDFLGKGLSGSVYGKRSKVNKFSIAGFNLEKVNVAFPDTSSLSIARNYKARNGSVSGNILKRFNFFFDYSRGKLQLKKNGNYKLPFYYNNSGITLEQHGVRIVKEQQIGNSFDVMRSSNNNSGAQKVNLSTYFKYSLKPAFQIVELRKTSNAKLVGLELGDVIISINGQSTHTLSLQDINKFFCDKEGKLIKMRIDRDGKSMFFQFRLDNVFKKKSLQNEDSKLLN